MIFLWLALWLICNSPDLFGPHGRQDWLVGLMICVAWDVCAAIRSAA